MPMAALANISAAQAHTNADHGVMVFMRQR
jgi:hypothetical protein